MKEIQKIIIINVILLRHEFLTRTTKLNLNPESELDNKQTY